jgi:hypothetical protein
MTILKSLNYIAMPSVANSSPEKFRRLKLVRALNEQKALASAAQENREITINKKRWVTGENNERKLIDSPKRLKRWWRESDGKVFFAIRYGNKIIEVEKGKAAIVVGTADKLVPTIDVIINAVQAGELDTQLSEVGFGRMIRKKQK